MKAAGYHIAITGGSRGIGLALAHKFLSEGNRVLVIARNPARLEAVLEKEPRFLACAADLSGEDGLAIATHFIEREFGGLNVLVNNAGVQVIGALGDGSGAAELRREIAVNVTAPVLLTEALLPLLRKNGGGAVVNVSSVLGIVPKESAAVYSASKAFVQSFSIALRYQLEGAGLRVFDIMPPMVDTDMTAGRGGGKITPEALADEFWSYWLHDKFEVPIGKTKLLRAVHRLSPALARRAVRRR